MNRIPVYSPLVFFYGTARSYKKCLYQFHRTLARIYFPLWEMVKDSFYVGNVHTSWGNIMKKIPCGRGLNKLRENFVMKNG